MKKATFLLLLFCVIFYNLYSSEDEFNNFIEYIIKEVQYVRELCIFDMVLFFEGHNEIYIIESKNRLLNISAYIKENIFLYNENETIKNIFFIFDYEINNILNDNNNLNSSDVLGKMDIFLELIISIIIIKHYEEIINEYNYIIMDYTSHNRIVNASPPDGGSGCVRLGRSLRSLPRLTPPQFASPDLAPQALVRAGKPSFTTGNVRRNMAKNYKKYLT